MSLLVDVYELPTLRYPLRSQSHRFWMTAITDILSVLAETFIVAAGLFDHERIEDIPP
jgi:hypothetical protein